MPPASSVASAVEKLQAAAQDAANSSSRSAAAFSEQAHQVLVPRAAGSIARARLKVECIDMLQGICICIALVSYKMQPEEACRVVSLSTCTKISAVSFAVGVVVGFTLKRRLRRWAARLLKRIKDDD
ncbi:hypothetical protein OsI_00364 [Oryza sativa Indica Group]|uniref:Uncharacterized protein n=1 Tax=Oryza sativa subsp. indica TaxID=39946 RepID=A2WKK7_ORYSI|nr:hypothetical protein OsI_00364 [Oryza sativa Indica Group]